MALDGTVICALVKEYNETLTGARIDKIYQSEKDEINIHLRGIQGNYKLMLSANASIPRICFTDEPKKNPPSPPMFCMLLRKHISGGRIVSVVQPDFERILRFEIESYDELGELGTKTLILEIMGRHSNIILTDHQGKILDSMKHVDFSTSSVRQVLPGLFYEIPATQDKENPMEASIDSILEKMKSALNTLEIDRFFLEAYTGISPLISREIAFRAHLTSKKFMGELDFSEKLALATAAFAFFAAIKKGEFLPCFIKHKGQDKLLDFSATDILQYGGSCEIIRLESMNEAVDGFYSERARKERITQKSAYLTKIVANNIDRCAKKIIIYKKDLDKAENMERYKQFGELITANIYRISQGDAEVEAENYYDDMKIIKIPLDTQLTPSKNAQKYFQRYTKSKNAKVALGKQMQLAQAELRYLESVEYSLKSTQSEEDLKDIADELSEQGYTKNKENKKKRKEEISQPLEFFTSDGFRVLVGKNNKQNDILTLKSARNNDMWFHTKDVPGSHTILKYEYGKEFSKSAIEEAAIIAARHSKASEAAKVAVDYTLIKNVKKPAGAKLGMVIYEAYSTVYVNPFKK